MTQQQVRTAAKALAAGVAACAAAFMVWAAFYGDIEVRRNEAQIQLIVDQQLNRLAAQDSGPSRTVSIRNVKVELNDRIAVTADVEGRRMAQQFSTTVFTVGRPDYRPNERAFFFAADDFKIVSFSYHGGSVAERATGFVRRITRNEEANNLAAELAPKLESWVTALAESSVKRGLERFPVYRLKDDAKGWVVSAALKSVEVKNGEIVAVVSLWQLTWVVIGWALAFAAAVGLLVLLLRNPAALEGVFQAFSLVL